MPPRQVIFFESEARNYHIWSNWCISSL